MAARSPAIDATVASSWKRISYRSALNPMNSMLSVMTSLFCGTRRMLDSEGGHESCSSEKVAVWRRRQEEHTMAMGAA